MTNDAKYNVMIFILIFVRFCIGPLLNRGIYFRLNIYFCWHNFFLPGIRPLKYKIYHIGSDIFTNTGYIL